MSASPYTIGKRLLWTLAKMTILLPLYALYGAWRLVVLVFHLGEKASWTARLVGNKIPCPSCRYENPLHGRWTCGSCGATFHGFVGACALCGAAATWMPCDRCGASIALGPRR